MPLMAGGSSVGVGVGVAGVCVSVYIHVEARVQPQVSSTTFSTDCLTCLGLPS